MVKTWIFFHVWSIHARRVLEEVVDMTHCDPQEVILAWQNNDSSNDIYGYVWKWGIPPIIAI